jgi:hypothetical protein
LRIHLSTTTNEALPIPAPVLASLPAPEVDVPNPATAAEVSLAHGKEISSRIARIIERMIENANTGVSASVTTAESEVPAPVTATDGLNALASLVDGERERRAREAAAAEYRDMSSPRPPPISPVSPVSPVSPKLEGRGL